MITHEEALQYVYLIEEDITNVGKELKKYIAQQQAKEERAKKVEELLGLYRKAHPTVSVFNPYYNDLVKKEKELEELK